MHFANINLSILPNIIMANYKPSIKQITLYLLPSTILFIIFDGFNIQLFILLSTLIAIFGIYIYLNKKNIWHSKNILINETTCDCEQCIQYRKRHPFLVLFLTLSPFIFTLFIVFYMLPYIHTKNESETEIETSIKIEYDSLVLELKTSKKTKYFEAQKIPNTEVIKGKKGKYYIITLENPDFEEKILFEGGKYIIRDFDEQLLIPLNSFMSEVYRVLDAKEECALFVIGGADIAGNETFKDKLLPNYKYTTIEYYPKIGDASYSPIINTYKVENIYTNKDLPNLRARFIQDKTEDSFSDVSKPIILQGEVKTIDDEKERKVRLLLFRKNS